jgi:broad specificity phosphatase PhoE
MNTARHDVYLVRHGETAWSITGQHTGRSDLALTSRGEEQARSLAPRLQGLKFDHVLSSPLQRALRTCELAGFAAPATIDRDLVEWDYGAYEGRTLLEIHRERPDWQLFRDGCPGGESVSQISERVDRVVARLRALEGGVLVFSSGHLLRILASRWIEGPAALGRHLVLDPACVCVLGYDHDGADSVIRLWNDH